MKTHSLIKSCRSLDVSEHASPVYENLLPYFFPFLKMRVVVVESQHSNRALKRSKFSFCTIIRDYHVSVLQKLTGYR